MVSRATCSWSCSEEDPNPSTRWCTLLSKSSSTGVPGLWDVLKTKILKDPCVCFIAVCCWLWSTEPSFLGHYVLSLRTASWSPADWCWYGSRCRTSTHADRFLGGHSLPAWQRETEQHRKHNLNQLKNNHCTAGVFVCAPFWSRFITQALLCFATRGPGCLPDRKSRWFNSVQFILYSQYHKLQICLRGLYNLYTYNTPDLWPLVGLVVVRLQYELAVQ